MNRILARIAAGFTALTLATAGINVVVAITEPVVAQASTVNGQISRGEVLGRAENWVDQGHTYNTNASAPGPGDGRAYRKDCSGLVAMAWHLSNSPDTTDFKARAQNNDGMHVIGLDSLQPGDAMVRDPDGHGGEGHMELFAFWKDSTDHHQGAYVYSFNSTGETVRNPYHNSNFGNLGFNSWSELTTYIPIRYNQITGGGGSGGADGSVNGDGLDDIVAVYTSGELTWYPNNGSNNFLSARSLGNAPGFRLMSMGDVNGDGHDDIVAVYTSGELVWYPNNGSDDFTSAKQLSNASGFRLMSMGDVNGDNLDDIVAVYSSGELMWYPNNGSNGFYSAKQLSNAPGFRLMSMGDVNGDTYDDIVAVYTSGELMWYQNNGSDDFTSAKQLSNAPGFRLMST